MSLILNQKTESLKQSNTKIQSFFGCDQKDDIKSEVPSKRCQLLKKMFAINKYNNKIKKRCKSKKQQTGRKPFQKSISWRPSLQIIYKDKLLLQTLIKFMTKSYNSENIFFILAVQKLQQTTKDLNSQISSIYNTYIIANASYQINISYHCFLNIMSKKCIFNTFDIKKKHSMFNECVYEIESLIITSILPSFYGSIMFRSTAKQSKYYQRYLIKDTNKVFKCRNNNKSTIGMCNSTTELSIDVNSDDYSE
eukprot:28235_1